MTKNAQSFQGVGLGLRLPLMEDTKKHHQLIDFLELAPENWIHVGGKRAKQLTEFAEQFPIICHGLSLSLGAPSPLNKILLDDVKQFIQHYQIPCYSEHLSYCSDQQGYLYDLLPIPFTEEAVHYVAQRIIETQDYLQQSIAVENISFYCAAAQELSELEFINAVLDEAQCKLLLDVNNVYVNSINHGYDPKKFIKNIKSNHIAYLHIAGHYAESDNLMIDTHGENIIDPVWDLLEYTYEQYGVIPTLLERDSNFPPFEQLVSELNQIHNLQDKLLESHHVKTAT